MYALLGINEFINKHSLYNFIAGHAEVATRRDINQY